MLEANLHSDNAFVTLTYSDEHLPIVQKDSKLLATLIPTHLSLWLKRLRKEIAPLRIRYFAVGEYGDQTERPHYHAIVFGLPTCRFGGSRYNRNRVNCCYYCDLVRDTWKMGQVQLGTVETSSAQYVCGYVTKKLTAADDPRLAGRHPEFARMSRKPGVGHDAMWDVASTVLEFDLADSEGDVPSSLRHGSREFPLGAYLRRSLRKMVGRDEKAPASTIEAAQEALRPMRETAFENSRNFKEEVVNAHEQQRLNQTSRRQIRKQRKSL